MQADSSGTRRRRESAPAKVNLGLRIEGRRDDGYHLLDSLFVPLELADHLEIELLEPEPGEAAVELRVDGAAPDEVPSDARNLAARAASGFLDRARVRARLRIALHKQIPAGAGLGGGSSDAAAVLRGLDALVPGALTEGEQQELALELGADVPFFLHPQPARVRGIGEQIEAVEGLPRLWLLLVNPGESLSTAEVYGGYDDLRGALTRGGAGPTMRAPGGSPASLGTVETHLADLARGRRTDDSLFENDLEPAAIRLCPAITSLRESLRSVGALATGMSGSGATVFGVFESEAEAHRASRYAAFEAPIWNRVTATCGSR